ncbi:MAG TPA: DUF2127 domain-containing protein [Polyangiales bacterium]|nr:DUF2127 domain-containing protein [Polyangiales bacterium]
MSSESLSEAVREANLRDPAYRAIVMYKWVRAGLALLACVVLAVLTLTGHASSLQDFSNHLRENATSRFSVMVAHALVTATAPRHLWIAVVALACDGGVTLVEAWSLQRGYRWGTWLVVAVVAAFLPFEVIGLIRHLRWGRALLLLGNLLVALYLVWRTWRETREISKRASE